MKNQNITNIRTYRRLKKIKRLKSWVPNIIIWLGISFVGIGIIAIAYMNSPHPAIDLQTYNQFNFKP